MEWNRCVVRPMGIYYQFLFKGYDIGRSTKSAKSFGSVGEWKFSSPFRAGDYLFINFSCPFRVFYYLSVKFSSLFRAIGYLFVRFSRAFRADSLVSFERTRRGSSLRAIYYLFIKFYSPSEPIMISLSESLVPFERFLIYLLNSRAPFGRFSIYLSISQIISKSLEQN